MSKVEKKSGGALDDALSSLPDAERDRLTQIAKEMREHQHAPRMELDVQDGVMSISLKSKSQEIAALLQLADIGTRDPDFRSGIVGQIACLGAHGRQADEDNSNFVFSVVRAVKPRDELEALLATQMGAIHAATMMMARKLNLVNTTQQQDSAERALNKLARTYVAQMDALKRYRTGGQQKVTVEHVTVNSGGQAIVGTVQKGGGG